MGASAQSKHETRSGSGPPERERARKGCALQQLGSLLPEAGPGFQLWSPAGSGPGRDDDATSRSGASLQARASSAAARPRPAASLYQLSDCEQHLPLPVSGSSTSAMT